MQPCLAAMQPTAMPSRHAAHSRACSFEGFVQIPRGIRWMLPDFDVYVKQPDARTVSCRVVSCHVAAGTVCDPSKGTLQCADCSKVCFFERFLQDSCISLLYRYSIAGLSLSWLSRQSAWLVVSKRREQCVALSKNNKIINFKIKIKALCFEYTFGRAREMQEREMQERERERCKRACLAFLPRRPAVPHTI